MSSNRIFLGQKRIRVDEPPKPDPYAQEIQELQLRDVSRYGFSLSSGTNLIRIEKSLLRKIEPQIGISLGKYLIIKKVNIDEKGIVWTPLASVYTGNTIIQLYCRIVHTTAAVKLQFKCVYKTSFQSAYVYYYSIRVK